MTDDPLVQYGRQLDGLIRCFNALDEKAVSAEHNSDAGRQARHGCQLAERRRQCVEAMVCETKATSLEGALVQVMLASASADFIAANTHEGWAEEIEKIQRLLYSAAAAIERHTGMDRSCLAGWFYMPQAFDPFSWERQCAA